MQIFWTYTITTWKSQFISAWRQCHCNIHICICIIQSSLKRPTTQNFFSWTSGRDQNVIHISGFCLRKRHYFHTDICKKAFFPRVSWEKNYHASCNCRPPQAKQQRFYWYAAGPTEALDGVMYIQANGDSPIQPTRSAQNISFLKQTKSSILYLPIVFWGSWYCLAS